MDWRNAGFRTKIGKVDGSVIFPLLLAIVVFHYVTILLLMLYAGVSYTCRSAGVPCNGYGVAHVTRCGEA